MTTTRRCTRCGKTRLASEFNRNSATPDGLNTHCRSCGRAVWAEAYARRSARADEVKARLAAFGVDQAIIDAITPRKPRTIFNALALAADIERLFAPRPTQAGAAPGRGSYRSRLQARARATRRKLQAAGVTDPLLLALTRAPVPSTLHLLEQLLPELARAARINSTPDQDHP